MFNTHKRRKHFHISKIKEIGLIRLILALGLAAVDTVWAVYMESFNLSESMIGFISAFLLITSLIAALTTTPILEKLREYKVLILSMIITIIALLSLTITKSLWIFLIAAIIITIARVFRGDAFDILFRDEIKDEKLNEEEGFLYMILNFSWFAGPLMNF